MAGIFRQEANEVELQRMSVHADFRRRGAGRKLVEAVCNWARNKGSEQVVSGTLDHGQKCTIELPKSMRL